MLDLALVAAGGKGFADRIRARGGLFVTASLAGNLEAKALSIQTANLQIISETAEFTGLADLLQATAL